MKKMITLITISLMALCMSGCVTPKIGDYTNIMYAKEITDETVSNEETTEEYSFDPYAFFGEEDMEVLRLINEKRAEVGTSELRTSIILNKMADQRATENAENNFFETENGRHKRPDGRNASSVAKDFNQYGNWGEIMARYQDSPEIVVEQWSQSPGHYAAMTNPVYTRAGVGLAQDSNGHNYWVVEFMD